MSLRYIILFMQTIINCDDNKLVNLIVIAESMESV